MKYLVGLALWISGIRLIPHLVAMMLSSKRSIIDQDVDRGGQIMFGAKPGNLRQRVVLFVRLMTFNPEYRNLFYHRTGLGGLVLSVLCPRMATLYIHTKKIGPGLFIQHGFSTIIAAAEIGENCWINQ